jgi:hypothetical protein
MNIQLNKTNNPDLSGFKFYVEAGSDFDGIVYEEAYGVALNDDDIAKVDKAVAQLKAGEWLEVSHG